MQEWGTRAEFARCVVEQILGRTHPQVVRDGNRWRQARATLEEELANQDVLDAISLLSLIDTELREELPEGAEAMEQITSFLVNMICSGSDDVHDEVGGKYKY